MENVNVLLGVTVLKKDTEELIRDSERLEVLKEYVINTDFINKTVLLAMLGVNGEGESNNAKI